MDKRFKATIQARLMQIVVSVTLSLAHGFLIWSSP